MSTVALNAKIVIVLCDAPLNFQLVSMRILLCTCASMLCGQIVGHKEHWTAPVHNYTMPTINSMQPVSLMLA
jgi:hypothetical protein